MRKRLSTVVVVALAAMVGVDARSPRPPARRPSRASYKGTTKQDYNFKFNGGRARRLN